MKNDRLNKKLITITTIVILTLLLQVSFVTAEDFPRGLHLSWQNDPASTMTIMWRSEQGAEGSVEYGKNSEYTQSIASETHSYRFGREEIYWHTVEISGLDSNTTYHYQAKSSDGWESGDHTFKTAVSKGEDTPFKFAVLTDCQGGYDIQEKAFKKIKEADVDFILYLGDFTDTGNQEEWDVWFKSGEGVLSEIPLMGVHGNHDGNRKTYWNQLAFPGNEKWFSIDYGNTHLVFLMTINDTYAEKQRPWLLEDLSENDSTWTIAMGHHPFYSSVINKPEYQFLRDYWLDILEEYNADLYFAGHNHAYERTHPIKNGSIDKKGITHVVHGPAGDKFYPVGNKWWSAVIEPNTSMYSIYSINESKIKAAAKKIDGSIVDEFELEYNLK